MRRGEDLFSKRGCLACHSHEAFPETHADFGPELTRVHGKVRPGRDGFRWLYTWVPRSPAASQAAAHAQHVPRSVQKRGKADRSGRRHRRLPLQKGAEKFPSRDRQSDGLDRPGHAAPGQEALKFEEALSRRDAQIPAAQKAGPRR